MGIDPGTAVLSSAVLATFGWLTTQRAGRRADRRKHTYEIIRQNQEDEDLRKAFVVARAFSRSGAYIANVENLDDCRSSFCRILDHYEYIAAAIWCGDVDEKLFHRSERSRIIAIENVFGDFIRLERQRNAGLPGDAHQNHLWRNLTTLAERWRRPRSEHYWPQRIIEWLFQRPVRRDDMRHYLAHLIRAAPRALTTTSFRERAASWVEPR